MSGSINSIYGLKPPTTFQKHLETLTKDYIPKYEIVDDTLVGIEVEVERVLTSNGVFPSVVEIEGVRNSFFLWRNVEDGSLRNNGREFVSQPVKGKQISFAVEELHNFLHKNIRCVGHEFTDRTSVHIHCDVGELTPKQLNNLLLCYIIVEPLIYKFFAENRQKNIFCVPINQTDLASTIGAFFHSPDKDVLYRTVDHWSKYTGFNIVPAGRYGTVEFRHMGGNINVPYIMEWINLILHLRKYAAETSFEDNLEFIKELNTTSQYMVLLSRIFPNKYAKYWYEDLYKEMEDMVCFIKSCLAKRDRKFYTSLPNNHKTNPLLLTAIKKNDMQYKETPKRTNNKTPKAKAIFQPAPPNNEVNNWFAGDLAVDNAVINVGNNLNAEQAPREHQEDIRNFLINNPDFRVRRG